MSGKTGKTHASTKKLEPGEDTIDRSTPVRLPDGTWRMQWTILLHDGRKKRPISTGPTHGQMLRNARAKAAELRQANTTGKWKQRDQLTEFMEEETKPLLAKASLDEESLDLYHRAFKLIIGDCANPAHTHKFSLKGHTIESGIRFRPLEDLLREVAAHHGWEMTRQCRTVLNKYVITPLIRDELVTRNPIKDVSLETLTGKRRPVRTRGGKALSRHQYDDILAYLLDLDFTEGTDALGRKLRASVLAKRQNAVDQMLLQAATGLRAAEANLITWDEVTVDDSGTMSLALTEGIAKGDVSRVALVLDQRVAVRMLERKKRANGYGYVIGAPVDPSKVWGKRNRHRAAAALYLDLFEKLGIEIMENERSHLWRTTLRSFYEGKVSTAVLNSQFGHNEETAQKHYTDPRDLSSLAEAAGLSR